MLRQIRMHGVRAFAAGAALLFAGAVSPAQAGSIDVRVTPEMRVVKSSPQPKTKTIHARWSRQNGASQTANTAANSLRAVHYPNVVLGSATYFEPSTTVAMSAPRNGVPVVSGELLPMQFGGFSTGAVTDGTFGFTDAVTVGVVTDATGAVRSDFVDATGVIRSDFIGIAGPGAGFGIAGPAFLPNGTVVRTTTINRSGNFVTGGINSPATSTGNAGPVGTARTVIGTRSGVSGSTGGASGNMVIGVGAAALSGGTSTGGR